jgi:5-(carboxyamino)imidazole ribonucleotide synthase
MNDSMINTKAIAPGSWLGMVGGGQLGRMFCHAAQSLGYKVAVLEPDLNSPAGAVADWHLQAAYDDEQALSALSERCSAITTEFENVPADSLRLLARTSRICPSGDAVAIVQDRIQEKAFIQKAGVPVAPYAAVLSAQDIDQAPDTLFPGILKVARLGYDGKGQARVATREQARQAFQEFQGAACVLEAMLPLASELSVVMARGLDGGAVMYPSASNEHRDGILAVCTVAPDVVDPDVMRKAQQAAAAIAQSLSYVGVLCVEFFVLKDGSLVANEAAPRPHNSGHYTLDACVSSQFEQQARALAGLPLGDVELLRPVIMLNLLGDLWFDDASGAQREPDWAGVLSEPGVCLHLYGKSEARKGRKMGHINIMAPTLAQAQATAARVAHVLRLDYRP